jgi:hypothetical protein
LQKKECMTQENSMVQVLPDERIVNHILLIRGQKVMIDHDLATLYEVHTKRLNEQVKRNIKRFPEHFMFELTKKEKDELVANCDRFKNLKHSSSLPHAFTEYGVLQVANVLNSERAILMGNRIIEVFVSMREMLGSHKEILQKVEQLMKNDTEQDKKITLIFEYLKQFEEAKQQELEYANRTPIGFKISEDK